MAIEGIIISALFCAILLVLIFLSIYSWYLSCKDELKK